MAIDGSGRRGGVREEVVGHRFDLQAIRSVLGKNPSVVSGSGRLMSSFLPPILCGTFTWSQIP